jgi:hypothetical protein
MKIILHPIIDIKKNPTQTNDGPYNFIRICERLGFIKNYFSDRKNVYSNSFIKYLLMKFKNIISEFDDTIYLPGMRMSTTDKRAPTKPEK